MRAMIAIVAGFAIACVPVDNEDQDSSPAPRPSFIVIQLDDARADGIDQMPVVQSMAAEGITFDDSFTPNAVCAPRSGSLGRIDEDRTQTDGSDELIGWVAAPSHG